MKKIYCDICKDEIEECGPHYVANVQDVSCKTKAFKRMKIDICNACYNVIIGRVKRIGCAAHCQFEGDMEVRNSCHEA